MGLHPRPIARRVATAHKANPQIRPRRRKNEVCMCKTFALQIWQATGLIPDTPLSQTGSLLHSDHLTASHTFNTVDDGLFTRHRLPNLGHPSPTASPCEPPCVLRSSEYAERWRLATQAPPRRPTLQRRPRWRHEEPRLPSKKATPAPEKTNANVQMRQDLYKCVIRVRSFHSLRLVTVPYLALGMGPA